MFIIIAALDQNHAIGHQGQLLFHLKDDQRFFKATTSGHPVIMGRKTWESLPKKLPGRQNIVVSRHPESIPPKHPTSTPNSLRTPENAPKPQTHTNEAAKNAPKPQIAAQTPDQTITDLPEFISQHLSDPEPYYVIGGAEIYRQFLPEAEQLLLTEIAAVAPVADTYFPSFDPNNYTREVLEEGAENGVKFSIVKYTRKLPLDKGAPMV